MLFDNGDGFSAGRADEAGDIVACRLFALRLGPHRKLVCTKDGPSMRAPAAGPVQQDRTALQGVFNADDARCAALGAALRNVESDRLDSQPLQG